MTFLFSYVFQTVVFLSGGEARRKDLQPKRREEAGGVKSPLMILMRNWCPDGAHMTICRRSKSILIWISGAHRHSAKMKSSSFGSKSSNSSDFPSLCLSGSMLKYLLLDGVALDGLSSIGRDSFIFRYRLYFI